MAEKSIMIIAGEASADVHGARVVEELLSRRSGIRLYGVGGAEMRKRGFKALVKAEDTAVAGLTEVLFSLPKMWGILRGLARVARTEKPSVVVMIDMPDFNLRLAKRIKPLGIPIVYYISPQVWAWRQKRVEQIAELVDQMLVILPFEKTFYQKHGVRSLFVGHPLVEELPQNPDRERSKLELNLPASRGPIIALLPGSRKKEVARHLPPMLEALRLLKRHFPEMHAVIPVASTIKRKQIEKRVKKTGLDITVVDGKATEALVASDAAVVASGTSTLQTALLSRPMVVVYRVSWLSYQILKRMIKVAHISLVNLIAERRLVPELVQHDLTPQNIVKELRNILEDPVLRLHLTQDFAAIRKQLGRGGAAGQVAAVVLNYIPIKQQVTEVKPGTMTAVRARRRTTDG